MPDIIQQIRDAYTNNPATALKLLPELFKQYDEERIPVLPCKIGTIVWCIYSGSLSRNACVFTDKFDYGMVPFINKSVFFDPQPAYAALKECE